MLFSGDESHILAKGRGHMKRRIAWRMTTTCRNLQDGGRNLPNQTPCPHLERMCWLLSLRYAIPEIQFNMKYFLE